MSSDSRWKRGVVVGVLGLALMWSPTGEQSVTAQNRSELKVGTLPVNKVLFLGNSITLHAPAPQIGWTGNWGMAASAKEKDYVHLLLWKLSQASGGSPKVMVRNIADFERQLKGFQIAETLKEELAFQADLVILAIGENAAPLKSDEDRQNFSDALTSLLSSLQAQGQPRIFVRSQFWPDAEKDSLLKKTCVEAGGVFVDLSDFAGDASLAASAEQKFEHEGVAAHPGDKGMAAIADRIWKAIEKNSAEPK